MPASAQAQHTGTRVYVFNAGQTLAQTRDGKVAMEAINARIKSLQAELEARAATFRRMQQKLDSDAVLTAAAAAQLQADMAREEVALRRAREDAEMNVADLRQRLLQPLEQRLIEVVTTIARERGADGIFNRPNATILHASDAVDLTPEIAKRMDALNP